MLNFKQIFLLLSVFFICNISFAAKKILEVANLSCEYMPNPLGVEASNPTLAWNIIALKRNTVQTSYRILVADSKEMLSKNVGNIWDSGLVKSDESIQVKYHGKALISGKTYFWKVQVSDNYKQTSAWSMPATWQMGLLKSTDWKNAKWIAFENIAEKDKIVPFIHYGGPATLGPRKNILPILRKEFLLEKVVKKATLFITGLGHFDASLNGKKIGNNFLDQGWTQYNKEALYVTFDLTSQLKKGSNTLGVMLGNGFYYIPSERYRKLTGGFGYPKMICRLAVEFSDGSSKNIISDQSWKTTAGPVTFSSIYGGEDYNATMDQKGWKENGFNDASWKTPVLAEGIPLLRSQVAYPLKTYNEFKPVKISQPKPGVWVYDLGQNASGIPAIKVKGARGSVIKISPAELLTDQGLITQAAVGAPVFFNYTLKGDGEETWQPQFTYYGFRYIQIEGGTPVGEKNESNLPVMLSVTGIHTRNSAPIAGSFTSSSDLFNKTYSLIDWAIKSNMASVFTDCPHREKLGWLEEAHLVGASIRYGYDIASITKKIVNDMIAAQDTSGLVPDIAPEYVHFPGGFRDSPEWGSNSVIMPWYVYQWYGNKQILEDAYPMMVKYVKYLEKKSKNHILSHGLGDWFDIGPKRPGVSQLTPLGVTATAVYYYDIDILSKVARLLGKSADAVKFEKQATEVRTIYNKTFFNPITKQYATGSQTANAISVYMGLVELQYKDAVIENIVTGLKNNNNALTAGDIGYRYLLRVLDDAGRSDVIFDMNSRSDVPGYGFQLAHGATALTESWQAYRNVSNNHFMLGHLMEWFYSGLGGIKPIENSIAFKEIAIRPEPVGDLTFAKTSYLSPYGLIKSEWKKSGNTMEVIAEIPANTKVKFYLPSTKDAVITESGKLLSAMKDIKKIAFENGKTVLVAGSGSYHFIIKN